MTPTSGWVVPAESTSRLPDPTVVLPALADIAIVGGGILGLAAAYKLLQALPGVSVVILEKEPEVGRHQSGHNSGVLHAGLSYAPGSAKARLAADGMRQMVDFCRRLDIPHEICGKLVIATEASQVAPLRALQERGTRNGLQRLTWLDRTEIAHYEPHAAGVAALRVPEEGIVDYSAVCHALVREIGILGGQLFTGAKLHRLRRDRAAWHLATTQGELSAKVLVNCAGLQADRVARMAGARLDLRIVPFRGQYYALRPHRRNLVRHLIYPVPDPRFPFLGLHLTRHISGVVDAGPNAMIALAREGYRGRDISLRDAAEMIGYLGLWRFLARHPRLVSRELALTLWREGFARGLQRLVPEIRAADLVPAGAGVRAQAMRADGRLVGDFVFVTSDAAVHLLNAPSPAATAALAIGDEVARRVSDTLGRSSVSVRGPAVTEVRSGQGPLADGRQRF